MTDSDWLKQLKAMLCRMYRAWGGDCADLPFPVHDEIQALADTYKTDGDPPFTTAPQLQDFLQLLSDTLELLDSPDNVLSRDDTTSLQTLIACLQTDLIPAT